MMKVAVAAVLGLSILLIATSFLARPSEAVATDLLPDIRPTTESLLDHDIVKDPTTGHILLRFSGAVANFGVGKLEVIGTRTTVDPNNNVMPAVQRIYRTDGTFHDEPAGLLNYHEAHHHYHYASATVYNLRDESGIIVTSAKQSFCLADVEIVNEALAPVPLYNRCYHSPTAKFVKMGVSPGWADVYGKDLIGQAFDVTALMQKPKQTYTLEAITNPDRLLKETNAEPQKVSIDIEIGIGVKVGVGKSRPGV